ncbi:MAG TPA: transposase [Pirellulaceae bacterium]|nr:transposase [Pirellulaceae bacterium]
MSRTIGYHWVKSTYGMWLPGDDRGSWSEAWDEQIGYYQPHHLHPGDPVRQRMAEERMKHSPVWMTDGVMQMVMDSIGECVAKSAGGFAVVAAAIEPTHIHVLIPYSGRDIHKTVKWIADQTTKAVHQRTDHQTPLWCKGKWCAYVFDESHWFSAANYIEQHNVRQERGERPYPFLSSPTDAVESRRLGMAE